MIYNYGSGKYKLYLEGLSSQPILLSPSFVENTKLKKFIDRSTFAVNKKKLLNITVEHGGYTFYDIPDAIEC